MIVHYYQFGIAESTRRDTVTSKLQFVSEVSGITYLLFKPSKSLSWKWLRVTYIYYLGDHFVQHHIFNLDVVIISQSLFTIISNKDEALVNFRQSVNEGSETQHVLSGTDQMMEYVDFLENLDIWICNAD